MAIATKKVTNRRNLHLESLDDILTEVDRLGRGPVKSLGNWSPGENLSHIAKTMTCSLDGFHFKMPWLLRVFCKVMKGRLLSMQMPAGFKLSKEGAADLDPSPTDWAEGVRLLRTAIDRLKREDQRLPSPAFGVMTREEWDRLHCRHAELHLSFLVPA
jgi:hypothetical protein